MNKRSWDKAFKMALQDGNGSHLWELLHSDPAWFTVEDMVVFSGQQFLPQIERFIAQNRLTIATAQSRFMLRRLHMRLRVLHAKRSAEKYPAKDAADGLPLTTFETG